MERIFHDSEHSPLLKKGLSESEPQKSPIKEKEIETHESSTVIGILCGHFFHMNCLEKWNDSICPLCRYYQHPTEHSKCEICGSDDNLWMCIICGFMGCASSGPAEGHIREHYEMSKHIYAIEVETKSVYDYSKGTPVHRLLQNAMDGKIIQHESESNITNPYIKKYETGEFEKKIDTVSYEYHILLSSQVI